MVSFIIVQWLVFQCLVMSRVGVQHNETFRDWHQMQRRNTTSVKLNISKTDRSFEKVEHHINQRHWAQ